jgi:2-dehydropantoate 2-reductase
VRAAIVGAGAVGSLLAHSLALSGSDVALLGRSHAGPAERRSLVRRDVDDTETAVSVTVAGAPYLLPNPPDIVIFAVKQFSLAAAVDAWSDRPEVPVLTIQNGIGAEEAVARSRGGTLVLGGSLTASVGLTNDGVVRRYRRGGLGLAVVQGDGEEMLARLSEAFTKAGLPTRIYADLAAMKWSKLVGNLVGNATGALVDLDPSDIYRHPGLFAIERRQILEAVSVVKAQGLKIVSLPGADVRSLTRLISLPAPISRPILARIVGAARGGKSPSLREHARSGGGPSEADWLNGAVVRAGLTLGVETPVNRALVELLVEVGVDPGLRSQLAGSPARVVQQVTARVCSG